MVASKAELQAPADGRAARTARTRAAILDAALALLDSGEVRATTAQIAERAGVSPRSIFQHFEDLDALHAAVADRQIARLRAATTRIDAEAPLAERIAEFVSQRVRVNEMISPVRRTGLLMEPFSPQIARRLQFIRELGVRECERVFGAELARLRGTDRRDLLEALAVASSWSAWESLRAHRRLSVGQAKRVVFRTITALLQTEARR